MGNSPSAAGGALERELRSLIASQKNNFNEYLLVLRRESESLERGDDGKLDDYRRLETAAREKIVSTARSLRGMEESLERSSGASEAAAELGAERAELEALRLQALETNASTQRLLKRKMKEVKAELDALAVTLRRLGGGRRSAADDPVFIDILS